MRFGDILKELLEQHNMTQKECARELDITAAALGNYIHNTREPDFGFLVRIADFFQVSTDYLLDHTTKQQLSHKEELLLHIFRSLTPDQKDIYLGQGQIFIRQNRKKRSSDSLPEDNVS